MKKQNFLNHFDTIRDAANFLDVDTSTIYAWPEIVPKGRAYEIFVRLDGKVPLESEDYN